MKKILIFIASFFLFVIVANVNAKEMVKLDDGHSKEYGNIKDRVKLGDGHSEELKRLGNCNFSVKMGDTDDDGNTKVTIEIENLDKSKVIILFGHAYPEKGLKKLSPSIKFDKKFPGTKGQRDIDTYRQTTRDVIRIEPSMKFLQEIQVKGEKVADCRFPLYIAKYKGKSEKKMLLLEKKIIELTIEVEIKPDEDLVRLDQESNDLIDEISKQTFCTNPKHKVSLEKQKAPYEEKIARIKSEIDSIVWKKWYDSDKMAQKYNNIKQNLNAVDFSRYEGDCGNLKNHNTSTRRHSCKYCNLSLQQIYHKLDDYYKKIYNSGNRKATKDAVMTDVNLLYRCCTDTNCTKHSSWNNSEYKVKITDRYNRICNF